MKYTKISISMVFALFFAYALMVSPALALTVGGGNSSLTTGSGGDTSSSVNNPAVGNGGDTSSQGKSNAEDTSSPAKSNGGDTSSPAVGNSEDTSSPAVAGAGDTSSPAVGKGGDTSSPAVASGGDTSAPAVDNNSAKPNLIPAIPVVAGASTGVSGQFYIGGIVTVSSTVVNSENIASQSTEVVIQSSTDGINFVDLYVGQIPSLTNNLSYKVTGHPQIISEGTYYYRTIVDRNNVVSESNENDNISSITEVHFVTRHTTDNSNSTTTPPVVSGGDTSVPSTPSTPAGSTGGGSGYVGGGGGGGRISGGSSSILPFVAIANTPNCSYLTTFMKFGADNDSSEVTKLQTFLKNYENIEVDINGTFDQKTFDAVKIFQAKYVEDIMAPWGVSTPTGQVYFTTKKKINEIVCKSIQVLTSEQISIIDAYKTGIQNGTIGSDTNSSVNIDINNATSTNSVDVGLEKDNSQIASIAETSILSKVWGFIKWLFGY